MASRKRVCLICQKVEAKHVCRGPIVERTYTASEVEGLVGALRRIIEVRGERDKVFAITSLALQPYDDAESLDAAHPQVKR